MNQRWFIFGTILMIIVCHHDIIKYLYPDNNSDRPFKTVGINHHLTIAYNNIYIYHVYNPLLMDEIYTSIDNIVKINKYNPDKSKYVVDAMIDDIIRDADDMKLYLKNDEESHSIWDENVKIIITIVRNITSEFTYS